MTRNGRLSRLTLSTMLVVTEWMLLVKAVRLQLVLD